MQKKIIGILDREEGYATRLMEAFNSKNRMEFQAEIFTGVEAYLAYSRKYSVEILLIGESLMQNTLKNTAAVILVITEGEKAAESEEFQMIYKYQSSEVIFQQVLEHYAYVGKQQKRFCKTSAKIYGIYAPQNRTGKSGFAWMLAKWLKENKQVLYIGLNTFHEIQELYDSDKDLADIMYYVNHGFDNLIYLVGSSVIGIDGIDCMPVVKSVEDLLHISGDDWLKLLQVIATQSSYEVIIINLEECVQEFYRILDYCNQVFIPYTEKQKNQVRWKACEDYFKKVGAEEVWKKGKQVKLTDNGQGIDIESIIST